MIPIMNPVDLLLILLRTSVLCSESVANFFYIFVLL